MIRKGLLLSLPPLTVLLAAGAWGWLAADPAASFPVHWGLDGAPDRFARRTEAFGHLPLLGLALTALFVVLPRIDPRQRNLQRSRAPYLAGWIGALWLLALIQTAMLLHALGRLGEDPDAVIGKLAGAGVAVLLAVIGNVLGKARPNWFVGVRTPWTLSSDYAWERTHRFSARLLTAVGAVGLLAVLLLPPSAGMLTLLVGALGAAGASVAYSYLVWRNAPDRTRAN